MTKPTVQLIGTDGNVFNLLSKCTLALKKARMYNEAKELQAKVSECESYNEALFLMMEYVDAE